MLLSKRSMLPRLRHAAKAVFKNCSADVRTGHAELRKRASLFPTDLPSDMLVGLPNVPPQ